MTIKATASKRILFLNIEGVAESLRAKIAGLQADPVAVAAINKYIAQPNTQVVIGCAEHIYSTYEGGMAARFEDLGLIGVHLHPDFRAFISGKPFQEGITAWIHRNGLEDGTEYLSICPEVVEIEGVIAIKTNYKEGLSCADLAYLEYLQGNIRMYDAKGIWSELKIGQSFPGE